MKNKKQDLVRLKHISKAINLVEKFCDEINIEEFAEDEMIQSAVIRQFEIIGEASTNISKDLKSKHPEVKWRDIKGFRNVLVHGYFRIDTHQVWETIVDELPSLKYHIESIINHYSSN